MSTAENPVKNREVVGYFTTPEALQEAIDELLSSGFDRAEISLLASEQAVDEKLGHRYDKVAELEDNTDAPRSCYVSTEARGDAEGGIVGGLLYIGAVSAAGAVVASGGALAAAITAAALAGGAGGLIGTALARFIEVHHAAYIEEQLEHGGMLLWVWARDNEHETRAVNILKKHSGNDVHVHDIPESS